jgi:predicted TPR repeat methyltransferase
MSDEAGRQQRAGQDSISLLDELAKIPPEPVPEGTTSLQMHAFLAVAMAKHREGQLAEAEQMYRQALRWQPDHPDAYHLLGLLAAQLNRPADALPLFEHAIALNPTVPEYHANYGNALMIASRIEQAEAAFAKAISLRSDFPEALMNLATVRRNRGDLEGAERLLHRALELQPDWPDAQINLANVALARRRFQEATALFARALKAEPNYVHAYEGFARAASRAGRLDEAAAAFRWLLDFDPDNAVARHLLAACAADPNYERAPEAYIRRLFDHYAPLFDDSLAHLQYRAPELIAGHLAGFVAPNRSLNILDAGCGTGLCGVLLKPFAARLVGVDLSVAMLKEADRRELYDELVEVELGAYMAAHPSSFDIIVCCDTLVYQGQLEATVAAAAMALQPGGRLLFTLEQLTDGGENCAYQLTPTGRFCHSAAYVRSTLAKAGLVDATTDPISPRLECGEPVRGLLVTARALASRTPRDFQR